ncbi:metallophosphoesterase [Niabella hibiscisoli]|uniref:metallophosphoesterase n=1 Tax=Niabella hibiscisoli TaxID=1825928 RepID=UPI001F1060B8|nr:metallophosphoesterase [Niabella hibiscisoli]MCH5716997.1 metallophosphoesterase [Niabella hibiscisoli]
MNRRKFTKILACLGGASALTGLYAWQVEPFRLEFVRNKMPVQNLPASLHGKILMQISDMHVGRVDKAYLIQSLKEAQAYQPDIVVYTGDFITENDGLEFDELQDVLSHKVKGKLGTVGILGNHDYGKGWSQQEVGDRVTRLATEAGITILRNNAVTIEGLKIIGIDDLWGTNYQPEIAMAHYIPGAATVVLSHNPDTCDEDIWNNYKGWILSGHTHGGQVKPPFLKAPIVPVNNKKYTAGEIQLEDGRTLYINRALGYKWQVRFNVRPEITIFELEPS